MGVRLDGLLVIVWTCRRVAEVGEERIKIPKLTDKI